MTPSAQMFLRSMFDATLEAAFPARTVPVHLPAPPRGRTVVVIAARMPFGAAGNTNLLKVMGVS